MQQRTEIWSISDVNRAVRDIIENSFMPFWIQGEVGTLNIHSSGHVYMTLKDQKTQLKVVFFNGANQARQINLHVGMAVEVYGNLTVYEVRGEYQFNAKMIRVAGVGSLQQQFEILKQKLYNEGLFAPERKKKLPKYPQHIGIISSKDGAAVRDFLQVAERRFSKINVKIYPATMQGKGAELTVKRGIEVFNELKNVDIIVITRGGGSMEDLWAFNEEILARTIVKSEIPVVSAIGHEIDFTITDFVADVRAATPSAAAEIVVPDENLIRQNLSNFQKALQQNLKYNFEDSKQRLKLLENSKLFREPKYSLQFKQQQIDELSSLLDYRLEKYLQTQKHRLVMLENSLNIDSLNYSLNQQSLNLERLDAQMSSVLKDKILQYEQRLKLATAKLKSLDPESVLDRGFAILTNEEDKKLLTSVSEFNNDLKVVAKLKDGNVKLRVRD